MITRYSSRKKRLDKTFLNTKLKNAKSYDRIAGYFRSSILEVAGEAIDSIEGPVRIVCNSDLAIEDVLTASAANNAMRREWCGMLPEEIYSQSPKRLKKLYELLKSGKVQVMVVPNEVFGLIHGKAGVITLADGSKTAFMGSVNESVSAWKLNYEILWEDDSPEAVKWVEDEFTFFWKSPHAVPLSEFVIEDIKRISDRQKVHSVKEWQEASEPAEVVVESAVYRQEFGLWEHQKYFVNLAFNAHKNGTGARYVLADMVGLGKTVQLALSAQLMALYGDNPILIIAPKTLLWQWQEEMNDLLDMPSAVWTGKEWVDENGIKYPNIDPTLAIKKCPRRVGIISQGLITSRSDIIKHILSLRYECVIVDESHRARRKNLGQGKEDEKPIPNNLMEFLLELSPRTKSMLLATATPVQLYPVEAWDLLNILSQKDDSVMGNKFSKWRTSPSDALKLIMGEEQLGAEIGLNWEWLRNPFPPSKEDLRTYGELRRRLDLSDDEYVLPPETLQETSGPDRARIKRIIEDNFIINSNPFIRHIVRRERRYLENTVNPETNEPYLKKIKVELRGENDKEAIVLPPYLEQAYHHAEEFSTLLQKRVKGGGFLKTLLLKRVGSTMLAGKNTAEKMLRDWTGIQDSSADFENEDMEKDEVGNSEIKDMTAEERVCLENFVNILETNQDQDPKYQKILDLLVKDKWMERGCILFSQFFDSIYWIAENLSVDLPGLKLGVYAGGNKSGILVDGIFERKTKEQIKQMVKTHELKILLGTDAASEGLNLQTLGSLINVDLPWNPTRLEQRKGRIQRIGQTYDDIWIYNMRYKDSVEDKVHNILSNRLENIHSLFGQLPDILDDVWVDVAVDNIEQAKKRIDAIPDKHPFEIRYQQKPEKVDWESCSRILDKTEKRRYLMKGWDKNGKESKNKNT